MTKEEWNKIKDEPVSYETMFLYYTEMGGKLKTLNEFVEVFEHLQGKMITNSSGRIVTIEGDSSREKVRNYYNDKFKG